MKVGADTGALEKIMSAVLDELRAQNYVPELRSAYHPHSDPGFACEGPSLTRQEFVDECDVNQIMARFQRGAQLPTSGAPPMYVDFTAMPQDLAGILSFLGEAEAAFMQLPAVVRREFDNDPVQFVDFASDPANLGRMQEWGLAPAPKEPPPASSPGGGAAVSAAGAAPAAAPTAPVKAP